MDLERVVLYFILSLDDALFGYEAGKTEMQSLPEAIKSWFIKLTVFLMKA